MLADVVTLLIPLWILLGLLLLLGVVDSHHDVPDSVVPVGAFAIERDVKSQNQLPHPVLQLFLPLMLGAVRLLGNDTP